MKIPSNIKSEPFGTVEGKLVQLYSLTNNLATQVKLSSYGGIITSWTIPMPDGRNSPIILGFDSLQEYLTQPFYLGATIGRYANLIAGANFQIDGKTYELTANHKDHHLHGGTRAFNKKHWDVEISSDDPPGITLSTLSKDLEEGYPGNLKVAINFQLTHDNELIISYRGETDKPTPVNLTNHMYFNLNGNFEKNITNHQLMVNADHITPAYNGITTGELLKVDRTPFDLRNTTPLAQGIQAMSGYNHNFLLNKTKEWEHQPQAILSTANGKRQLEIYTSEPALQVYTGNSLDGEHTDRSGIRIDRYSGICLETQKIPNSPNHPHFPSTTLHPGKIYLSTTIYKIIDRPSM